MTSKIKSVLSMGLSALMIAGNMAALPMRAIAEPAQEPIVITAFKGADEGSDIDYTQNYFLKMMAEKTGVMLDVKGYVVPPEEVATKKQLLLAGDDYPDIFLAGQFTSAEIMNYGVKEQMFIPLNDLIENTVNIKDRFEQRPQYYAMHTAPDGNVYGLPHFSECGHCRADTKIYVNIDWLDKLGLSIPTTTEEFYNMLVAFKQQDPNGNGKADEIPLTSNSSTAGPTFTGNIINAFIAADTAQGKYTRIVDGKVEFAADKPEFKEALVLLNKMYAEGLIDPAAFTQNTTQLSQVVSSDPTLVGAFITSGIYQVDMDNAYVYQNYRTIDALTGPNGVCYTPVFPIEDMNAKSNFTITDKCKDPEAAMRWMDEAVHFDNYMMRVYGLENEGWKYAEPGDKNVLGGEFKYVFLNTPADEKTSNVSFFGGPWGSLMEYRAMWSKAWPDEIMYTDKSVFEARIETETAMLAKHFPETMPDNFFLESGDETSEYGELHTTFRDYVGQSIAQFVTGTKSIEKDWDAYVNDLERYNLPRYLELLQKGYDSTKAK